MREFGYPPGWLEEAKVQHSGMNLFHNDQSTIADSDEEEGEVDADKSKYDINKIIDFVGFNVRPDFKYKDESDISRRIMPMKDSQLKRHMIEKLKARAIEGYKRKKLMKLPSSESSEEKSNNDDDIAPPGTDLDDSIINLDCSLNQASLDSLEKRKQQLLLDINASNSLSPGPSKNEIDDGIFQTPGTKISIYNSTKFEVAGTPLLQFSPYTKLPVGDAFSVGVSDVICFENLPDSTGKYEQMKGVIGKVRLAIQKLHKENDE